MIKNDNKHHFEEGVAQNQKDVIRNMLHEKFSLELISKCVNLPLDKVKQIIKEIEQDK